MKVRVGSGNKYYHYTHWTVLVDRLLPINVPELSRQTKVIPPDGLDPNLFFLSDEECAVLKQVHNYIFPSEIGIFQRCSIYKEIFLRIEIPIHVHSFISMENLSL